MKRIAVCDTVIIPLCTLCTFGCAFGVCVLLWLRRENRNQFGGGHHLFDSLLPASTGVIDEAAGKRRTWNKVLGLGGGCRSAVGKVEGGRVIIEVYQVF